MTDEASVAHAGEADEDVGGLAGNDEVAGRRGHAAIDERGVARAEHADIDKLHGLSILVHHTARELAALLLYAFHEDQVGERFSLGILSTVHDFHADGIEADDLADGVGNRLVAHVRGHLEVFQVVVGEVDHILVARHAQIAQRVSHGGIAKRVGDGLGAEACAHHEQHGEK